jgi:hypothetical protein
MNQSIRIICVNPPSQSLPPSSRARGTMADKTAGQVLRLFHPKGFRGCGWSVCLFLAQFVSIRGFWAALSFALRSAV